ncbi:hypothetical protein [Bacillus fonticola]|nr:hypothetical protein [Bacillus fonticola]
MVYHTSSKVRELEEHVYEVGVFEVVQIEKLLEDFLNENGDAFLSD